MPTMRLIGHRIRAGTQTVANITSTYEVTALPVQADMDTLPLVEWLPPTAQSTPPTRARIETAADGTRLADGFYQFEWRFSYFTFNMLSHWLTTFLPSGVESAAVSVMTYDNTNTAVYLNCTLERPALPGDAQPAPGGWADIVFRFTGGTIIT